MCWSLTSFDAIGNRLSQSIAPTGGAKSFTYDALSQLTNATNPSTSFAYDGVGNRTTAAGVSYTANTLNQYTQVGSTAHTYDKAGNLLTDGTNTYTYDAENRVTKIVSGANTLLYTYDGLGRRISRSLNGVITRFYYDGLERIADRNAAGVIEATYLFGPGVDEVWSFQRGSDTRFYSHDGLGSPLALTDAAGAVLERYSYTEFGAPTVTNALTAATGSASFYNNPILFTGREWEPEAGVYYYRARYYSPVTGRFLSRDPLGYAPDLNIYRYVGNNPAKFVDPYGLWSQEGFVDGAKDAAVGAAIGLGIGAGLAALVAAGAIAAPVAGAVGIGMAVLGGAGLGLGTGALITGRTLGGKYLSDYEKSRLAIGVGVGWATLGLGAAASKSGQPSVRPGSNRGGLNLFKSGDSTSTKATGWQDGDYFLRLPDQGSAKANWYQNASRLRSEMRSGNPIFDSYRDPVSGQQIPSKGFLGAERNLLENRGWRYSQETGAYSSSGGD